MTTSHVIPETPAEFDTTRIIERPDGFYWQDRDSGETFGPFATLVEAVQDLEYNAATDSELEEPLTDQIEQAEEELGISDWVDPETGELAEDELTRLEDH